METKVPHTTLSANPSQALGLDIVLGQLGFVVPATNGKSWVMGWFYLYFEVKSKALWT